MSSNFKEPKELEVQITALLLGELSATEAESLRARIASDSELRRLHDDLKKTIELVQQTTTSRDNFTVPIGKPPVLSTDRREKLLASFKTVPLPTVTSSRGRRDLLALAAMVLGLAAVTSVMFRSEIFYGLSRGRKLATALPAASTARMISVMPVDTARSAAPEIPPNPSAQSDSIAVSYLVAGGAMVSPSTPEPTGIPYDPNPQPLSLAQKEGKDSKNLAEISNPTPAAAGGYGGGARSGRIALPGSSPASSSGGQGQARGDFDALVHEDFIQSGDTLSGISEGFWGNKPSSDSKDANPLPPALNPKKTFTAEFADSITVASGGFASPAQAGYEPTNGRAFNSWGGNALSGTGLTASLWGRPLGESQNGGLGVNYSTQDQTKGQAGTRGMNGDGEKKSGAAIEAGKPLSSDLDMSHTTPGGTKTYFARNDGEIAQSADGSLKKNALDVGGPAVLGDPYLWQLLQTPPNHASNLGGEGANAQITLNNAIPQVTNAIVAFGSVVSGVDFSFNGTTTALPPINETAPALPKPIDTDGDQPMDSFGVSGRKQNTLGFDVSGRANSSFSEAKPAQAAARPVSGSGVALGGLHAKVDDLADLEKGKPAASSDPKLSKGLDDRTGASLKLFNLVQRSAETEEASDARSESARVTAGAEKKVAQSSNEDSGGRIYSADPRGYINKSDGAIKLDPSEPSKQLGAIVLPTLPEGGSREKVAPVPAAPVRVPEVMYETKPGEQSTDGRDGITVTKPVTRETVELRRKLDEAQKVDEQLRLRIVQEEIDAKIPKTSIVEVVDQAEAHPSEQPGFWKRLRTGLTGKVERNVRVKVEKDTGDVGGLEGKFAQGDFDPYWVQTEFEAIQSKAVLSNVIEKLNLTTAWGEKQGGGKPLTTEEAYRHLKENVTVQQDRNNSLVNIRVRSDKPEEAARIANPIAETYRDLRQKQRLEVAQAGIKSLQKQLGEQEKAITDLSQELEAKREDRRETVQRPKSTPNAPVPQPESQTADNPFSTFSLNVSDVSYKLASASLEKGVMPDPASIRSEEFINAFDYRDPEAPSGVPIAFNWDRAAYPFAQNRDVLRFSLKTAARGREPGKPLNLVLLLDNSGSMERADRVRIIHECLRVLGGKLQPQDRVSAVSFSRRARLWMDGIPGDQATDLPQRVGSLTPEGGTNLEEAMNVAYQAALKHYLTNGANRIVLLTDGAANLGNVDPELLKKTVENYRKQGIALDCFGIGWEGYNDDLLEVLSRNGDGRYGFVNTPEAATDEFASQLAGALQVAASDVKVQVEFNPRRVSSYRQIGYAKHQLTKEQFRDNTVDAAELGAAEAGNALYVVDVNPGGEGPLATVRVRYKVPGTTQYHEKEWAVPYNGAAKALDQAPPAIRLASIASAFSEWLAGTPYASEVTPSKLLSYFPGVIETFNADPRPKKLEWMIREASRLSGNAR